MRDDQEPLRRRMSSASGVVGPFAAGDGPAFTRGAFSRVMMPSSAAERDVDRQLKELLVRDLLPRLA
jgi:hypothetical protein